jgi:hypothetical protein
MAVTKARLQALYKQARTMFEGAQVSATWTGQSAAVTGVRGALNAEEAATRYGNAANVRMNVRFVVSDLAAVPADGTFVTVTEDGSDSTYQVLGHAYDETRATIRLDLGEQYA